MATIKLYAEKVNQMPGLMADTRKSVIDYHAELFALKNQILKINKNICNLDNITDAITISSKTQEQKSALLKTFQKDSEQFIENINYIDNNVAEIVNQKKESFYEKYSYLKPEYEKNEWEQFCETLDGVGEWCKKHWKEIVIGFTCIVVGAILTALTGGFFAAALLAGLKAAAISALISGGLSMGISLGCSMINGDSFGEMCAKALNAFGDGLASGFMFGGIFAFGSQALAGILRFSSSGTITLWHGKTIQIFKGTNLKGLTLGKIKIWSPNNLTNANSGGTLIKFGRIFRIDVEAGKQLFHTHITTSLFNTFPNFIKNMNWLFDPARRDVHVRLTELLGGLIGAINKKE